MPRLAGREDTLGSWVVLPEPVAPATMITWSARRASAMPIPPLADRQLGGIGDRGEVSDMSLTVYGPVGVEAMTSGNRFTDEELAAWRPNLISWQLIERVARAAAPGETPGCRTRTTPSSSCWVSSTRCRSPLSPQNSTTRRARMSHAVARLEESGWVERVPDASDRGVTLLRLTG